MRPMQGIFAHAFAAVMAFTVFTFPTPQDLGDRLIQLIGDRELVKSFPNLNKLGLNDTKIAFLGEHVQIAETCAVEGMPRAWAHDCSAPQKPSTTRPGTGTTGPIRVAYGSVADEELAGRLVCQALWADAVAARRQFDVKACLPA